MCGHFDTPADDVGERGHPTAIGNVLQFDTSHRLEYLARQVRRGAVARAAKTQRLRRLASERYEFRHPCDRYRRVDHEDQRRFADHRNRGEVGRGKRQLAVEGRIGRQAGRGNHQGVAIRLPGRDRGEGYVAPRADPVLHDEVVAGIFRDLVENQTADDVSAACWRIGDDDPDRAVRVGLCMASERLRQQRSRQDQNFEAMPHVDSSFLPS